MISEVISGFDGLKYIDDTRKKLHIEWRTLHNSELPISRGKSNFKVCLIPAVRENSQNRFILMIVRSVRQFNTVVYHTEDRYRVISGRNFVLMDKNDMTSLGLPEDGRVTIKYVTGTMTAQKAVTYPI